MATPTQSQSRLDLSGVFSATLLGLLLWTVAVLAAALSGYPGVVCMTPVGWVISLNVGITIVNHSHSLRRLPRLLEAALGGTLVGLYLGLLMGIILGFSLAGPETGMTVAESWISALLLFLVFGGGGAVVCAVLAFTIAAFYTRYWVEEDFIPPVQRAVPAVGSEIQPCVER